MTTATTTAHNRTRRPVTATAWLTVHLGTTTRTGTWHPRPRWITPPAADYRCRCGWHDTAAGDAVAAFAAEVRGRHASQCKAVRR
ncbi:hypothetical protein [Streptomyces aidingensis]|uniref:Uncharacterized protein n=1 Tax=Streptomyces aidingensis TaxID=910347 RepID=A0A1I1PUC3_9ACTN|nr:hypothetical protein [Streptomyces aidingensis]SFD13287.1 hypothetical protein SAMN05421773_11050 [Streptomyces aidingensis]